MSIVRILTQFDYTVNLITRSNAPSQIGAKTLIMHTWSQNNENAVGELIKVITSTLF